MAPWRPGSRIVVVTLGLALGLLTVVRSQEVQLNQAAEARRQRFTPRGTVDPERPPATPLLPGTFSAVVQQAAVTEAPTGFDSLTNGLDPQGPDFESVDEDTVVPLRSFNDNRFIFEAVETVADGLGPTYNAQSARQKRRRAARTRSRSRRAKGSSRSSGARSVMSPRSRPHHPAR